LLILNTCPGYSAPTRIAVVKSRNLDPYNTALDSFKTIFKDKGYNIQFSYYDLEGKPEEADFIFQDIKTYNPDLILTFGTEATRAAKENITDIPVVFSVVFNPVGNGFVQDSHYPANNLTGVALDVPVEVQFKNLLLVLPGVRRLGAVYNPEKTGKVVEQAEEAAGKIDIELIKVAVSSEKDVPAAIESLKGKIDALWAPVDNTVYNPFSTKFILLFALRNKIPLMGFSEQIVKAGAVMGIRGDYEIQGKKAANIAIEILKGKRISNIPVVLPDNPLLFLNRKAAQVIGIELPAGALEKAKYIFE
ncbi:MAG: ABC transporter substrate-binding protein, partial [Candidatus Omnitrophica bacterium]|nr:ABC transporter substrate-binding protein [Candidatus Omnitrophota bacterium]